MKNIILIAVAVIFANFSREYKSYVKLTVIIYDNQNQKTEDISDTVFNQRSIDLTDEPVDLFFSHKNFQIPYYVPTAGIYKNRSQDQECDWKIYPGNVRCYKYDKLGRVAEMSISGSGVETRLSYKYNTRNQVVEISESGWVSCRLSYNNNGTLLEINNQIGGLGKRVVFIYD